jgi:hypothetical protein
MRDVSDSLQLRRFCLLPLTARVPDESTVRKLVRRLGPEVANELTRVVIGKAQRETRFALGRCGSTRRWCRPTSAIPPMGCCPWRARGRWRAGRSWPVGCVARPCGWWIVPGGSAGWCVRSPGRWRGALASARARFRRSTPRRGWALVHSVREARRLTEQARAAAPERSCAARRQARLTLRLSGGSD